MLKKMQGKENEERWKERKNEEKNDFEVANNDIFSLTPFLFLFSIFFPLCFPSNFLGTKHTL